MEIITVIIIGILLLVLLGAPLYLFMEGLLVVLTLADLLCVIFFLLMIILVCISKPRDAEYERIEKEENKMAHAFYKVEGERIVSLFPTDLVMERYFYKKKKVKVRMSCIKGHKLLFDKMSLCIILVGLVAFSLFAVVLRQMLI